MTFVSWAALAVGLLVVAPLVAHLLRRRPPPQQSFAATALVPPHAAVAERRTAIEDHALLGVRALSVLALALLGATPLLQCSRLSLAREGGGSVAVVMVVDDSLSMRAATAEDAAITRFEAALLGAHEMFASLQPGDAVAIVLAGKPARVALAPSSNLGAAKTVLDRLAPSDRGTDLAAAVRLASGLLVPLEQVDKRVVLLSDLAVAPAQRSQEVLRVPQQVKLWIPLEGLRGALDNCGVVRADRQAERVVALLHCSELPEGAAVTPREVHIMAGDQLLASTPLPRRRGSIDITLQLSEEARSEHAATQLYVRLSGGDAIAEDDQAPVMTVGGELVVGVVADAANGRVATGGPPAIEQAFAALRLGVRLKPMAATPEQAEALNALGLLVVEDAPGFTPAQRRELGAWVTRGGVLLLALGERSASAPLGSGFSPLLPALLRWDKAPPAGLDPSRDDFFGEAAAGMDQLAARGRVTLEVDEPDVWQSRASWSDGAPLLVERRMGRGVVYALTLPLSTNDSEFMLRAGSLALLHRLVDSARAQGGARRTLVGQSWPLDPFDEVTVVRQVRAGQAVEQQLALSGAKRFIPERLGAYELRLDGDVSQRVAALDPDEVGAKTLDLPSGVTAASLGSEQASVDISSYVALLLLALFAAEMLLRSYSFLPTRT